MTLPGPASCGMRWGYSVTGCRRRRKRTADSNRSPERTRGTWMAADMAKRRLRWARFVQSSAWEACSAGHPDSRRKDVGEEIVPV